VAILCQRWLTEKFKGSPEVSNWADDIGEKNDRAAKHPDIVARIEKIMKEEHVPSAIFPLQTIDQPAK
jgi:arylsulfatase